MKTVRKTVSLILCTLIFMALAGCTQQTASGSLPGTDNSVQAVIPSDSAGRLMTPLEDYGLTVENIMWSNLMTYLLNRHSSVQAVRYTDGVKYVEGYFDVDGRVATVFTTVYPDGTMESEGFFDRYIWTPEDDRVVARAYVEYLEDDEYTATDNEYAVNYCFMDAEAAVISATDTEYTLFVHNYFDENIITIDKRTLDIKRVETFFEDGESIVTEYIYDEPAEGTQLFDTWKGPKKNVTVIADIYKEDGMVRTEKEFEIAPDWELLPDSWDEIALYTGESCTEIYEYPGYAQDYTVYVTNAMG